MGRRVLNQRFSGVAPTLYPQIVLKTRRLDRISVGVRSTGGDVCRKHLVLRTPTRVRLDQRGWITNCGQSDGATRLIRAIRSIRGCLSSAPFSPARRKKRRLVQAAVGEIIAPRVSLSRKEQP
jgi:hypothetical protein